MAKNTANAQVSPERSETAPLRKIVEAAGVGRRTRAGIMKAAVLECGHLVDSNAGHRRRGHMHCWDCYYGKPQDPMGRVVVEQHTQSEA